MSPALCSTLLVGALLLWWLVRQQHAEPIMRRCGHCGDLVYYAPGLPTRCPSCGRLTFI